VLIGPVDKPVRPQVNSLVVRPKVRHQVNSLSREAPTELPSFLLCDAAKSQNPGDVCDVWRASDMRACARCLPRNH
jgi:hypothetical protein